MPTRTTTPDLEANHQHTNNHSLPPPAELISTSRLPPPRRIIQRPNTQRLPPEGQPPPLTQPPPTNILRPPPLPTHLRPPPPVTPAPAPPPQNQSVRISHIIEGLAAIQSNELRDIEEVEHLLERAINTTTSIEQKQILEVKLGFVRTIKTQGEAKLRAAYLFNSVNITVAQLEIRANITSTQLDTRQTQD